MSSLHNAITRAGSLVGAIRTAVGMKESGSGVERLGETLTPVMDVWSLPEWRLLRGEESRWQRHGPGAGGAGTAATVQIVNPVGSRLLCVVELVKPEARCRLSVEPSSIALTDRSGFRTRDGRAEINTDCIIRVASGNPVPGTSPTGWVADVLEMLNPGVTLPPGTLLQFESIVLVTDLIVNMMIRYRNALPGELE